MDIVQNYKLKYHNQDDDESSWNCVKDIVHKEPKKENKKEWRTEVAKLWELT